MIRAEWPRIWRARAKQIIISLNKNIKVTIGRVEVRSTAEWPRIWRARAKQVIDLLESKNYYNFCRVPQNLVRARVEQIIFCSNKILI